MQKMIRQVCWWFVLIPNLLPGTSLTTSSLKLIPNIPIYGEYKGVDADVVVASNLKENSCAAEIQISNDSQELVILSKISLWSDNLAGGELLWNNIYYDDPAAKTTLPYGTKILPSKQIKLKCDLTKLKKLNPSLFKSDAYKFELHFIKVPLNSYPQYFTTSFEFCGGME